MSCLKVAFHAHETKVASLLSSNLVHFLQNLPIDDSLSASLQKNSRLSSSHKAQILLCSIEEGDGIGYHELLRVLEKDAVRDPLSKKVVSCVRDAMARTREEDTPLQYEG